MTNNKQIQVTVGQRSRLWVALPCMQTERVTHQEGDVRAANLGVVMDSDLNLQGCIKPINQVSFLSLE